MTDILAQLIARPAPITPMERVVAFARDLAEGALNELWGTEFSVVYFQGVTWQATGAPGVLERCVAEKWQDKAPALNLLLAFGYLTLSEQRPRQATALLTEKAFRLLEQPIPSSIFISYSRRESSAFALLVLARLREAGLDPFLDIQDLQVGEDWHARLKAEVSARQHFVCLVGPSTLDSPYVREEIQWAEAAGARTIPIWHGGFRFTDQYPEVAGFLKRNAIVVEQENTKAYHNALLDLLNYFGFTPT